jgi:hypothetical protein
MESSADYAWAFAVIGGPILLAVVIAINVIRSRRRPKAARDATSPRSYPHNEESGASRSGR